MLRRGGQLEGGREEEGGKGGGGGGRGEKGGGGGGGDILVRITGAVTPLPRRLISRKPEETYSLAVEREMLKRSGGMITERPEKGGKRKRAPEAVERGAIYVGGRGE